MTVSLAQAPAVGSGFTGSATFGSPVTAGNSVILLALGYNGGGFGPSYSNPLLGGSSVSGASGPSSASSTASDPDDRPISVVMGLSVQGKGLVMN